MARERLPELWRSPFEITRRMSEAMDDLFRGFFEDFGALGRFPTRRFYGLGSTDIYGKEGNLVYETELPGVKKEDLKIRVEEGCLTIVGERKKETKVEEENYLRMGRSYGSFQRSFPLPEKVKDEKQIKAKFEDGILKITVPLEEPLKKKAIDIRVE